MKIEPEDLTDADIKILVSHSHKRTYDAVALEKQKASGTWDRILLFKEQHWMWTYDDNPKQGLTSAVTLTEGRQALTACVAARKRLIEERKQRLLDEALF